MNLNAFVRAATGASVRVHDERCLVVRHKRSSCTFCQKVCSANAIVLCDNSLFIDTQACTGCGACAVACPTEALEVGDIDAVALADNVRQAMEAADGVVTFACAAMATKSHSVHAGIVEICCLAAIDESILVNAVAGGARELVLVDAGCANCPLGECEPSIDETIRVAHQLLDECTCSVRFTRSHKLPSPAYREDTDDTKQSNTSCFSRRQFLGDAANTVRDFVARSADIEMQQQSAPSSNMYERRRSRNEGLPFQLTIGKHERTLAALALLAEDADTVEKAGMLCARGFADVSVDAQRCNGCGVCALFCPTGALRIEEATEALHAAKSTGALHAEEDTGVLRRIAFTASACIGCRLCKDLCLRECIAISPFVLQQRVIEREVRYVEISLTAARRKPGAVAQAVLAAQTSRRNGA